MAEKLNNIYAVIFENSRPKVKNPYELKRQNLTKQSHPTLFYEPELSLENTKVDKQAEAESAAPEFTLVEKEAQPRKPQAEPTKVETWQEPLPETGSAAEEKTPVEGEIPNEVESREVPKDDESNEEEKQLEQKNSTEIKDEQVEKHEGGPKNAFLLTMEALKKQSKSRRPQPEEQPITKKIKSLEGLGRVSRLVNSSISAAANEDSQVINFEEKQEKKGSKPMLEVFGNQEMRFSEKKIVAPWLKKKTFRIKDPMTRLHCEIMEFYKFITPSKEEHQIRIEAFQRLRNLLTTQMPGCDVKTFGSLETKLYLRGADIDLVVIDNSVRDNMILLNKVSKILMNKTSDYENINRIRSAKVPLVKCVEKDTKINFDISFNKIDGLKQIDEVKKAVEIYPEIKYLIMLLKCVLRQRDLNETYTGGVGSFLLFCMTLAFLRELRKEFLLSGNVEVMSKLKLSDYLIKLLEFYGCKFDCSHNRILMHNGGCIEEKDDGDNCFSLLSPQDPQHDIGSAAFKIREVFNFFKNRFYFMTNYNFSPNESILKYIVNPSGLPFFLNKSEAY